VTFRSGDLELAGTLFLPPGSEPAPAVVLIHGSGPTDRWDLEPIAEVFAGLGIAALAYDKRGVGESDGSEFAWRDFSLHALASDAAAGLTFLRGRSDMDREHLGIFGVSQGGWVAPLAARSSGDARFMVLMSASVTTIAEDNVFERAARLRSEGFTEAEIEEARAMHLVDLEVSRTGTGFEEFVRLWNENLQKRWFRRVYTGAQPMPPDDPHRLWYRTVMDFDPVPLLQESSVPAIWLFGDPDIDRFAPVRQSADALEALRAGGKEYEIHLFPGADHSLQLPGGQAAPFRSPLADWLRRQLQP
jgi:pimeloyl-ACP methyl ester carboxylesterase